MRFKTRDRKRILEVTDKRDSQDETAFIHNPIGLEAKIKPIETFPLRRNEILLQTTRTRVGNDTVCRLKRGREMSRTKHQSCKGGEEKNGGDKILKEGTDEGATSIQIWKGRDRHSRGSKERNTRGIKGVRPMMRLRNPFNDCHHRKTQGEIKD